MSSLLALTEHRPVRFLIAGGANTALGLAFFPLLVWSTPYFQAHYLVALAISQIVCLLFAFATHKLGVFRTRGGWLREFAKFSSYYVFNYAVNWAALPLLVDVGGAPLIPAQLGITLVLIIGSWFWHSRVTFRP
jgi:putative flippase GtrA